MGCEVIRVGGITAIACSRGRSNKPCGWCRKASTKLCDAPVPGHRVGGAYSTTCDAPVCDAHATSIGPDRDVCPEHVSQRV